MMEEKVTKAKCLETITKIMNVKILTPIMTKKVNELRAFYDYVVIEKTFKECENNIRRALKTKDFNSEFAKAKYILSIIVNNIDKVYKKHLKDLEDMKRMFSKDEQIIVEDLQINKSKNSNISDISAFLD